MTSWTIDCNLCPMDTTDACDSCVVSALIGRPVPRSGLGGGATPGAAGPSRPPTLRREVA